MRGLFAAVPPAARPHLNILSDRAALARDQPFSTILRVAEMTRPGPRVGYYRWGGTDGNLGRPQGRGDVELRRRRFDEVMGQLLISRGTLEKVQKRLLELQRQPDFSEIQEAVKSVRLIHQHGLSIGRQARALDLVFVGRQARQLRDKALVVESKLRVLLRNYHRRIRQGVTCTPFKGLVQNAH